MCRSETQTGSRGTFSLLHLSETHNSCLTLSRARDLAPRVLSQHLFKHHMLSTCLIRFSNKVSILSEYLCILMENSPPTSQTLYLWLNINIPDQHIFHRNVWDTTRSSHVVYSCDFLQLCQIGKLIGNTKDIKKRGKDRWCLVGREGERMQTDPRMMAGAGLELLWLADISQCSKTSPLQLMCPLRFIYMTHKTGGAKCNCQEDIITRICF